MGEQRKPTEDEQQRKPTEDEQAEKPVTTGDMQEVGATTPEEVERRRRDTDGAAPVIENPGDQNSG